MCQFTGELPGASAAQQVSEIVRLRQQSQALVDLERLAKAELKYRYPAEERSQARLKLGLQQAGYKAAVDEAARLRVENAVLRAKLDVLLEPPAPEGWIVTEGPKELLP